jgi:zinc protease
MAVLNGLIDRRLSNGMRVLILQDHRIPIAGVSLWYAVGSRHEARGRSGFAHLFEHMMFQGSANVGKGEHFNLVQSAGGRTNARTDLDATVYSEVLPSHQLELAFWLEADRLRSLGQVLTQATLDNQREVVLNERRKKVDNAAYGTWEEHLFSLCYPPRHPYHHSSWGTDEDLGAATLDDVRDFFATYYVPNNATLAIVGDVDVGETLVLSERHFGDIRAGGTPPPTNGGAPRGRGQRRELVEDVPLPRLFMGCRTPPMADRRFDAADFVTDVLTTGRASRLPARLVREQQVAQYAAAWITPMVDGAALLVLEIGARDGVAHEDLERALDIELDRVADEPPDEDELARVRGQRATNRATLMERVEERADRLGMYACLLDDPARFGTENVRDAAITSERIADVARTSLARSQRTYLWYLPERG